MKAKVDWLCGFGKATPSTKILGRGVSCDAEEGQFINLDFPDGKGHRHEEMT